MPRVPGYHARHQSNGGKTIRKESANTHWCFRQMAGAKTLSEEISSVVNWPASTCL